MVISNKAGRPTLNFQENYFKRMQETDDKEVQEYIKDKKNEFEWLERAVNQRGYNFTCGQEIVRRQKPSFRSRSAIKTNDFKRNCGCFVYS